MEEQFPADPRTRQGRAFRESPGRDLGRGHQLVTGSRSDMGRSHHEKAVGEGGAIRI